MGEFEEEMKDGTFQGVTKEQVKQPVFKMKKKTFEQTEERPFMSNSCYILGLNKIPNFNFLT